MGQYKVYLNSRKESTKQGFLTDRVSPSVFKVRMNFQYSFLFESLLCHSTVRKKLHICSNTYLLSLSGGITSLICLVHRSSLVSMHMEEQNDNTFSETIWFLRLLNKISSPDSWIKELHLRIWIISYITTNILCTKNNEV